MRSSENDQSSVHDTRLVSHIPITAKLVGPFVPLDNPGWWPERLRKAGDNSSMFGRLGNAAETMLLSLETWQWLLSAYLRLLHRVNPAKDAIANGSKCMSLTGRAEVCHTGATEPAQIYVSRTCRVWEIRTCGRGVLGPPGPGHDDQ